MRYLATILSMIILAFSTTTCSDELPALQNDGSSYQITEAGMHQHAHTDFCSPLCACGCCAAPVILPMAYFMPVQTANTLFVYSEAPAGVISDISPSVWQPPQA